MSSPAPSLSEQDADERTEFETPISIQWDGRARQNFEQRLENDQAQRTLDRAVTRVRVETTGEAQALLAALEHLDLVAIEPWMLPTFHRVRDDLIDALAERCFAVEDGRIQERELLADGGQRTCEHCGFPITHTVSAGPGETQHSCGCSTQPDLLTDGGIPETFDDLRSTCESCGDRVDPERLIDGECPGCTYRDDAQLVTDGGTAWTDLTGFRRDVLEAIRRLETDGETTYGLAIKRELERHYGEAVNHGRLYPNLDELVDASLIEKRELDKRTNEYTLTTEAEAMLEERARLLADACGMDQPVADGGEGA